MQTKNKQSSSPTARQKHHKGKCDKWSSSVSSLVILAGTVVNNFPLPDCWEWQIQDVIKWLQDVIILPQYEDCFARNFINGRSLLLVDASVCVSIGIHDFQHIKLITEGIRQLFKVEMEEFKRSISLPKRYPWTHYLLYQVPNDARKENTTPTELFGKMGILDAKNLCPSNHWGAMNPETSYFPYNLFGYGRNCKKYPK